MLEHQVNPTELPRIPGHTVARTLRLEEGRDKRDIGGTIPIVPVGRPALQIDWFDDISPSLQKRWLVRDVFGEGELSCLYGAPGSGKSVLATDLAAHVAAGREWHGKRVTKAGVLYVAAERGALVKRRLAAWRQRHGVEGLPLAVASGTFNLCHTREDAQRIAETALAMGRKTGVPVGLIIVDTLAQVLVGGDENSGKDMGAVVANLSYIQQATGAHVLVIHHVPHGDAERMRGHGALLGAVDTSLSVERPDDGPCRVARVRKANDGPDHVEISFALASELLHTDAETGEETTAPVVTPDEGRDIGGTRRNVPLNHSEELARRALVAALVEQGRDAPIGLELPNGIRCVAEENWRSTCYSMRITESDNASSRRKAFARAADGLQRKGRIGVQGGWVWLV